jgi:hypothetical protein
VRKWYWKNPIEPAGPAENKKAKEKVPLTNYLILVCYIVYILFHLSLILKINSMDILKMHVYPNYLLIYYVHLLMLPNFGLVLTSLYFTRNHSLREMVVREVKNYLSNLFVRRT